MVANFLYCGSLFHPQQCVINCFYVLLSFKAARVERRPMIHSERQQKILSLLEKKGVIHSGDLIKEMNVSKETIRRDLVELEEEGLLKRVYGGAVKDVIDSSSSSFMERANLKAPQKEAIANIAISHIHENMSIALDVSTTNLAIAKALKAHFKHLTIVTNSLVIANELVSAKAFNVILTGGALHHEELSLTGDLCRNNLQNYHVDLYFLSCNGISLTAGITDFGEDECLTKKTMISMAKKTICVATSDRFDVISLLHVAPLNILECIITDNQLPESIFNLYKNNNISIVCDNK